MTGDNIVLGSNVWCFNVCCRQVGKPQLYYSSMHLCNATDGTDQWREAMPSLVMTSHDWSQSPFFCQYSVKNRNKDQPSLCNRMRLLMWAVSLVSKGIWPKYRYRSFSASSVEQFHKSYLQLCRHYVLCISRSNSRKHVFRLLFPVLNKQIRPIQISLHSYLILWSRVHLKDLFVRQLRIMETGGLLFHS